MKLICHVVFFAVLATFAGCDEPCRVPGGKYEMKYKKLEGDCPDELVNEFDNKVSEIDIEDGACRLFTTQHAAELPNGCKLNTDMSAALRATGIHDGQAAFVLSCTEPKPYTCRHLFTVDYKLKEKSAR